MGEGVGGEAEERAGLAQGLMGVWCGGALVCDVLHSSSAATDW